MQGRGPTSGKERSSVRYQVRHQNLGLSGKPARGVVQPPDRRAGCQGRSGRRHRHHVRGAGGPAVLQRRHRHSDGGAGAGERVAGGRV